MNCGQPTGYLYTLRWLLSILNLFLKNKVSRVWSQ
jgi:hypothetical protein